MKEELLTDALLREFLLGRVNDEERERIENSFLTDSQTKERVLAIEQDLVEDYLEGSLNQEEKERFLTLYAQTAEQQRELRITKSIKDWAVNEAKTPQVVADSVSIWDRLFTQLRLKPVWVVPIAATVVIAIVFSIFWLNSMAEQRRRLAAEQELVQLNSQRNITPDVSLELTPGLVRGPGSLVEFTKRADLKTVELRLVGSRDDYTSYRASVRRIGDTVSFTIPNLHPDSNGAIRLKLFADKLNRGDYLISLVGINSDGSAGLTQEYPFTVL